MGRSHQYIVILWVKDAFIYGRLWLLRKLMEKWKKKNPDILETCHFLCLQQSKRAECCFRSKSERSEECLYENCTCSHRSEHCDCLYTWLTMRGLKAVPNGSWIREWFSQKHVSVYHNVTEREKGNRKWGNCHLLQFKNKDNIKYLVLVVSHHWLYYLICQLTHIRTHKCAFIQYEWVMTRMLKVSLSSVCSSHIPGAILNSFRFASLSFLFASPVRVFLEAVPRILSPKFPSSLSKFWSPQPKFGNAISFVGM